MLEHFYCYYSLHAIFYFLLTLGNSFIISVSDPGWKGLFIGAGNLAIGCTFQMESAETKYTDFS